MKRIIDLQGPEGNAFFLLGLARIIAEAELMENPDGPAIQHEMMGGDYHNLLKVFKKYFGTQIEFKNEPHNGTTILHTSPHSHKLDT
jgi:hypothetical protein